MFANEKMVKCPRICESPVKSKPTDTWQKLRSKDEFYNSPGHKLDEKEPSTESNSPEVSPTKDSLETSRDKRHAEKRKLVVSTLRNKLKISDIKRYVIKQDALTGDITTFSDVYKIKGLLGVGGFGVVLAVNNRQIDEDGALKIGMKSDIARVINEEGNVLSSLRHPNIIQFRNFYETNSRVLMEMELCKGGTLKKMNRKFSEDEVLVIMRQLISAIEYIHSKDYIHRDIKPENILFKDKSDLNTLKLIDFGLSTIYPGMINQIVQEKFGTLLFMAPEQTDYSSYGKKIDIWAGGMIMYQLLTGKHPYLIKGDTVKSYLKRFEKKNNLVLPEDLEVSDMGRDFHSRLGKFNPVERYEAKTAMLHPWILGDHEAEMPMTPLEKLKMLNSEYQLKNAMRIVFSLAVLKKNCLKTGPLV